jgi:hypothetical protein
MIFFAVVTWKFGHYQIGLFGVEREVGWQIWWLFHIYYGHSQINHMRKEFFIEMFGRRLFELKWDIKPRKVTFDESGKI